MNQITPQHLIIHIRMHGLSVNLLARAMLSRGILRWIGVYLIGMLVKTHSCARKWFTRQR